MCEQEDGEVELCCCSKLEDAVVEELVEDIAGEDSEEELRGSWSEVGVGAEYADGIINPGAPEDLIQDVVEVEALETNKD